MPIFHSIFLRLCLGTINFCHVFLAKRCRSLPLILFLASFILIALVWLYTVIRPIARPTATPPYDMFTIYLLFLGSSILQTGALLYDHTSSPISASLHHSRPLLILVAVIGLLYLVLSMPLAAPNNLISPSEIVRKPFNSLDNG